MSKVLKHPHHIERLTDALLGFLLGLGAPTGWLVWRIFQKQPEWLKFEFSEFGSWYIYLTVGTVTVFTLFGYFLGRKSDVVSGEADQIQDRLENVNLLAITDALTNINNARYLHDQLSNELEAAKRYNNPLSGLMIDIDNFKIINDRYGHPAGDRVLVEIAAILRQCVRRVDIVGRLGGEEFLVIMPHTPLDSGYQIAERIRQAVQRWPIRIEGVEIPVTVSNGVASYPAPGITDKSSFLKLIDIALYEAKRQGKNRTKISSVSVPAVTSEVK